MIEVAYCLHGNTAEAGSIFPVLICDQVVYAVDIEENFPFEGPWVFRVKEAGIKYGVSDEYVWVDLEKDMVFAFEEGNKILEVRALPCVLPTLPENEDNASVFDDYTAFVGNTQCVTERKNRQKVDTRVDKYWSSSSNKKKTLLEKVSKGFDKRLNKAAKGLGGLWGKVSSAASSAVRAANDFLSSGSSVLSDTAEENLAGLAEDLASDFMDDNPVHVRVLKDVWQGLCACGLLSHEHNNQNGDQGVPLPFLRSGVQWKNAGFQNEDPTRDLKASGVLALKSMAYMCQRYPVRTSQMLTANRTNVDTHYPFAVVMVAMTDVVAGLLQLPKMGYLSHSANYWEMFDAPEAFHELLLLGFMHIDNLWTQRSARRSDFKRIMTETREMLSQVLDRGPKNLNMLRAISEDEGMVLPALEHL